MVKIHISLCQAVMGCLTQHNLLNQQRTKLSIASPGSPVRTKATAKWRVVNDARANDLQARCNLRAL